MSMYIDTISCMQEQLATYKQLIDRIAVTSSLPDQAIIIKDAQLKLALIAKKYNAVDIPQEIKNSQCTNMNQ